MDVRSRSGREGLLDLGISNRLDHLPQGVNVETFGIIDAERDALPIMADNLRDFGLGKSCSFKHFDCAAPKGMEVDTILSCSLVKSGDFQRSPVLGKTLRDVP